MALPGLLSMILPVLVGVAVLFSTFVRAQDTTDPTALVGDPKRGKIVFQRVGYCVNCHGWAGDGQSGRNPLSHAAAANLRETKLDAQGLFDVIRCGIPGTEMPFHDGASYKDGRCFGMLMSDYDADSKPVTGNTMRTQDIMNVVAYLQSAVIGKGKPNYEECAAYFDAHADTACAYLKSN